MRVVVGLPLSDDAASPSEAAAGVRRWLDDFDARLSRFKPDSELSAFNRDERGVVPASVLLRTAVRAGQRAAERSGGLVDPTLVGPLEEAGYRESRAGVAPEPLREALAAAPPRRPARPRSRSAWREFEIDDERGTIRRPPGLRFDPGGIGKGLAADAVSHRLGAYERFAIDCAGDLHVGGPLTAVEPFAIEIAHPLGGGPAFTLHISGGGVATSGLGSRLWRRAGDGFAHHLLDPASGEPAWTGLVSVTAVAASTLEAETLSKTALLSGPEPARALLRERGGLLIHDSGEVEPVGPLAAAGRRVRLRLPPR